MSGFRRFLLRGNLVDLAVAVVIGTAFAAVVAALVKDIITPLIAAIGGQPSFASLVSGSLVSGPGPGPGRAGPRRLGEKRACPSTAQPGRPT